MNRSSRLDIRSILSRPQGPMGWIKRVAAILLAVLAIAAVIGIAIALTITALAVSAIAVVIVAAMWGFSRLFRKKAEANDGDMVLVARRGPNGWEVG
jgi:FtsH-binding integral membrane protein